MGFLVDAIQFAKTIRVLVTINGISFNIGYLRKDVHSKHFLISRNTSNLAIMAAGYSGSFEQSFVPSNEEEFTVCPYNKRHIINKMKFTTHLLKCRENHRVQQLIKRGSAMTMTCKYNHNHKVDTPELQYHESHCMDRYSRLSPFLIVNKQVIEEELGITLTDKMFEDLVNNQINANNAGIYKGPPGGDKVMGSQLRQQTAEPEAEAELDDTTVAGAACLLQKVTIREGKKKNIQLPEHLRMFVGEEFGTPDDDDDDEDDSEEDWGKNASAPTFNFLRGAWNPGRSQMMRPPRLTRSGRARYEAAKAKFMGKTQKLILKDIQRKQGGK
ncbi:unnamed protein product [Orchesella dallaii]|uniref:CHHC U11-48K-type domain-containing protein n=1 Tax=Orchesella dallaii TaxID=48710 RepID=A0ABP1QJB9_9HEXA